MRYRWYFMNIFKLCPHLFFRLFSLKGTYRNIVSKAEDLQWSIYNHDNLDEDLLLSDIEVLTNKEPFKSLSSM